MKRLGTALIGTIFATALASALSSLPVMAQVLNPGYGLARGQSIYSDNGFYQLILQNDGNLVLYDLRGGRHRVLWASGTDGQAVKVAVMQGDGNFVLYKYNNSSTWATGTDRNPGSWLVVQNDGNVVIYRRTSGGNPTSIWATNTLQ